MRGRRVATAKGAVGETKTAAVPAPAAPQPTFPVATVSQAPRAAPMRAPASDAAPPAAPGVVAAVAVERTSGATAEADGVADARWLCFRLGQQAYAVEVTTVQEVLRVPDIAPVAGARPELIGVINLRGQIVPVFDLSLWLGLGVGVESAERRIVVLEHAGEAIGLLVDGVADVFMARADTVQAAGRLPNAMPSECFCGFLRRGAVQVVALDGRRLFDV